MLTSLKLSTLTAEIIEALFLDSPRKVSSTASRHTIVGNLLRIVLVLFHRNQKRGRRVELGVGSPAASLFTTEQTEMWPQRPHSAFFFILFFSFFWRRNFLLSFYRSRKVHAESAARNSGSNSGKEGARQFRKKGALIGTKKHDTAIKSAFYDNAMESHSHRRHSSNLFLSEKFRGKKYTEHFTSFVSRKSWLWWFKGTGK